MVWGYGMGLFLEWMGGYGMGVVGAGTQGACLDQSDGS